MTAMPAKTRANTSSKTQMRALNAASLPLSIAPPGVAGDLNALLARGMSGSFSHDGSFRAFRWDASQGCMVPAELSSGGAA